VEFFMSEKVEVIYDLAGNPIAVGDTVVCISREPGYRYLTTAQVVALNPRMVTLEQIVSREKYGMGGYRMHKVKEAFQVRHNAVYFCRGVK
jgi:hypothetical protein